MDLKNVTDTASTLIHTNVQRILVIENGVISKVLSKDSALHTLDCYIFFFKQTLFYFTCKYVCVCELV